MKISRLNAPVCTRQRGHGFTILVILDSIGAYSYAKMQGAADNNLGVSNNFASKNIINWL